MKDWLPTMPDLSAWQEWPFHWIALGLLVVAGGLLILKRITSSKGTNMGWNWPWNKPAATAAAASAPAAVAAAPDENAALRAQITALLAQVSELTRLLHQSTPVQMTPPAPAAPAPSLPPPPPPAVAPVAPSPAAAPASGGGTPLFGVGVAPWMPTAPAKNIHSNTPDRARWPDLTADGLPIFYMLAPGQGADAGKTVVVNPHQYAVYYDGEYMPPHEVTARIARNIARDGNLAAADAQRRAQRGRGAINVNTLTDEDLRYLRWESTQGWIGGDAIYWAVLEGTFDELSRAQNRGGDLVAGFDVNYYSNPALQAAVAILKGKP